MEENREPLSAIAIEKKLQLLRNKHFSEDTIALVKSDYEYGLTEEEISLYLNKSYDIEQMKILSECLHKDVPKDVIDIIKNTKYCHEGRKWWNSCHAEGNRFLKRDA